MVLFGLIGAVVLPAFAIGSSETLFGALAVVGSAVLAADGSWTGKVIRLPVRQPKPETARGLQVVELTTSPAPASQSAKYDSADSQSLVLRRFSELKDYIEAEPAFAAK